MSSSWPRVQIGKVIKRSEEWIDLLPTATYRQVTVRLWGKGVVLRGEITGAEIASKRRLMVRSGQFIFSRIDARNGAFGIIPVSLDRAVVSNDFPVFTPDTSRILPSFLAWMSKTNEFVELCRRASEGTTNRVRLREDRFLSSEIPLPPIEVQRRIVLRIDELANKVEEARRLRSESNAEAGALLTSIWRQLFARSTGWQSVPLEECCDAIIDYRGRTPPVAEEGIPHLTSRNIKGGRIDWKTRRFVSQETYDRYMTRGIPKAGDVIFTMEAPLGEAAVIPDGRPFSLAQRTLLLRPKADTMSGQFLARALTSPQVRDAIYATSTGTTVKGIASKRLKRISLPVPPVAVQNKIVKYLDDIYARMEMLKQLQSETAAELDALMPSILSKAFSDELC